LHRLHPVSLVGHLIDPVTAAGPPPDGAGTEQQAEQGDGREDFSHSQLHVSQIGRARQAVNALEPMHDFACAQSRARYVLYAGLL
jgi:hypothetical protein